MDHGGFLSYRQFSDLLPDRLYGREKSTESLHRLFDEVCKGECKLALVPGKSGVGKTVLVQDFRGTVEARGGLFIEGKFDQYSHSTPYSAYRQAISQLAAIFLQESTSFKQKIKAEISGSLGSLGGVITQFVPAFEKLLGQQPQLQDISSQEAVHRFLTAFSQLFKAICKPEQPLVLFIDDWQWADSASLLMLKELLSTERHKYLLIIAAYRSDEVGASHPFASVLNDLSHNYGLIQKIHLDNLSTREIRSLVKDTFGAIANLKALGKVIVEKTAGSPFFVHELLIFFCARGYIYKDSKENWTFDVNRFEKDPHIPDTIVSLYSLKIGKQRDSLQEIVAIAAYLGSHFSPKLLSIVAERPVDDLREDLRLAETLGLIIKQTSQDAVKEITYRFCHDKIQQAAHKLIRQEKQAEYHLRIGRLLLKVLSEDALEQNLFEVTPHFNQGAECIDSIDEKIKVIELNLAAARKARQSVAYKLMLHYHQSALSLIDENVARQIWLKHKDLGISLYKDRSESEFLEGSKSEAEQSLLFAAQKADNVLQKTDILNDLIIQYTLVADYESAIRTAREALSLLGQSLPEDHYELARDIEIDNIRDYLSKQDQDYLQSLPTMTDPKVSMATKIMITMGPPCYRSDQKLWAVIVSKVVSLVLEHGDIPQVGYSHTAFAGLLLWVKKDFALAKKFGEATIHIMKEKFAEPSAQSVFYLMVGSSYRHWFNHLKFSSADYLRAYDVGVHSGNLQYAAYGFGHNMYCQFFQGVNLDELITITERSLEFSQTRLNQWAIDLFQGGLHLFSELSGKNSDQEPENDFEQTYLHEIKARNNIQVRCIYHVIKAFSLMVLNKRADALLESDKAEEIIYTVGTQGLLPWPEHTLTRFLIISSLYRNADTEQQLKWCRELESTIEALELWATHCPENYRHKLSLAKAEVAWIEDRYDEAARAYVDAIQGAKKNGFSQWQAIANERAAEFFESSGLSRLSVFYWQKAYANYKKWGALRKTRQMKSEFKLLAQKESYANGQSAHHAETDFVLLTEKIFDFIDDQSIIEEKEKFRHEIENKNVELSNALKSLQHEIFSRKTSERQASLNELRMRLAIDAANMGVWHYDLIENRRYFDATTCELLGIDSKSFTGHADEFFAAIHPDDHQIIKEGILAAIERGLPYSVEYRSVRDNGEIVYLKNYAQVVRDEYGKPERLHGILFDVTGQILQQREREEFIQTLREKTEQQERFAHTVSHDLKAPLVTINGFTSFLEENFKTGDSESFQKNLGFIKDSASRMKLLIDDLLRLSRIGTKPSEPVCCNLREIIGEAILDTKGYVDDKQAKLILQKSFPDVCVDRQGFLQVFENLIANAFKFSAEEEYPVIEIGTKDVAGELICFVKDNGKGIEDDDKEKIFQIFVKIDKNMEGSGVGLSIVKQILEAHKCKIWVESEGPGTGSIFNISLNKVLAANER